MGTEFTLTPQPIRLTAPGKQNLDQALEVGDFDSISALLGVLSLEGTAGPSATVRIITGMQKDTEDGWVPLLTFDAQTAANKFDDKHVQDKLLKYVRWELFDLSGTTPAVTFNINGMLRAWN